MLSSTASAGCRSLRTTGPFIRKYTFPARMLALSGDARRHGTLRGLWCDDMKYGRTIASTVKHWRERFAKIEPRLLRFMTNGSAGCGNFISPPSNSNFCMVTWCFIMLSTKRDAVPESRAIARWSTWSGRLGKLSQPNDLTRHCWWGRAPANGDFVAKSRQPMGCRSFV